MQDSPNDVAPRRFRRRELRRVRENVEQLRVAAWALLSAYPQEETFPERQRAEEEEADRPEPPDLETVHNFLARGRLDVQDISTLYGYGLLESEERDELERMVEACEAIEYDLNRVEEIQEATPEGEEPWQSLEENGEEEKRRLGYVLDTTASLRAIDTSRSGFVARLKAKLTSALPLGDNIRAVRRAASKVLKLWELLAPVIRRAARSLWPIVSNLVTPRSWTIGGGISFPGLAKAELSVTFGG